MFCIAGYSTLTYLPCKCEHRRNGRFSNTFAVGRAPCLLEVFEIHLPEQTGIEKGTGEESSGVQAGRWIAGKLADGEGK
jgi:hypothetical protein